MRRGCAWLVSLPIVLVGIVAAHAVANGAFGAPEGPAELFASRGSGAGLLPLLSALAGAFVVLGLCARVTRSRRSLPPRALALPFACLPPVTFVLLEIAEGVLHRGIVPVGELVEPTFLVGLALQVPFAIAGYLVTRVLLRLSDRVWRLVRRRPAVRRPVALRARLPRPRDDEARSLLRRARHLGRAPPIGLAASR